MKTHKKIILLAVSILSISGISLLPGNQNWLSDRILPYWKDFKNIENKNDPEYRRQMRYETAYTYSKFIAAVFEKRGDSKKVLVLLPPSAYFKKNGINYNVPEPAVFYYYTGLKTVWVNSEKAGQANWLIRAKQGHLLIDSVKNQKTLSDTIAAFKKFPVSL